MNDHPYDEQAKYYEERECLMQERIDYLEVEIERLRGLLKVAKCPSGCEDGVIIRGAVQHEYGEIEYDIEQCQWCDEVATLEGDNE